MTKHTPGPWIAVGGWVEHPEDSVADICICDPILLWAMGENELVRPADEIYANARLIAAAPEMLDLLRELMEHLYIVSDEDDTVADELLKWGINLTNRISGEPT